MRSDVIEKMIVAFGPDYIPTPHTFGRMHAAAKVLLDEVLGPVSEDPEKDELLANFKHHSPMGEEYALRVATKRLLETRRAKIEQPKTIEERIIVRRTPGCGVGVYDGDGRVGPYFLTGEDAEIYRLGLIAQLKSKEQQ